MASNAEARGFAGFRDLVIALASYSRAVSIFFMPILRNSVYFFAALAVFAIAAFWPSYLSRISAVTEGHVHAHGAVMASWLAMLIAQAFLIRSNRRPMHRLLGKASYVLAPLVVLSTLSLAHMRLAEAGQAPSVDLLYFLYVQFSLLGLFLLCYSLATYHRKSPQVHARYMACTALTLIDPIFARIDYAWFGIDFPLAQMLTYGMIYSFLVGLAIWDWKHRRPAVFLRMLPIFVIVQLPTFFVYKLPAWQTFAVWYGSLPLL